MVGNCTTLKKSGLFRCWSRLGSAVSMLSALTWNSNRPSTGLLSSRVNEPAMTLNRPQEKLVLMCLTRKTTDEWVVSAAYVSTARTPWLAPRQVTRDSVTAGRIDRIDIRLLRFGSIEKGS